MSQQSVAVSEHGTHLPDIASYEMTSERTPSSLSNTPMASQGSSGKQINSQECSEMRDIASDSSSTSSVQINMNSSQTSLTSQTNMNSSHTSLTSLSWPSSTSDQGDSNMVFLALHEGFKGDGGSEGERWGSGESKPDSFYSATANHDVTDGIISDIQHIMSRSRSASAASLDYYRTDDTTLQVSAGEELQGPSGGASGSPDRHPQQSRRLPFWMWFIIAKSLGIKLHPQDKPILATVLYTLSFMSALGYFLSNWWFTGFDIASDYTKTTVIDGTVSILYTLLWGALGLYANKLAYKLFSHKKFLDMLRLHSKTILKLNASAVLFTLMLLIAVFNNINAYPDFMDQTCHTVGVEVVVCKARYMFRVLYSIFAVMWNYLVAFVLVSTCRTHVIGIRRFMKTLEKDARIYESKYMGQAQASMAERPVLEEYTWVDEDYLEELGEHGGGDLDAGSSVMNARLRHLPEGSARSSEPERDPETPRSAAASVSSVGGTSYTASTQSVQSEALHASKMSASGSFPPASEAPQSKPLTVMTNAEILFRFWKIQTRLRMSSMALQRWMMSVVALVVVWLAMNLIIWLNYEPTLIDMANFFLPLALLPLLASAYAEVNQEGQRVLKFICPLEERLHMLYVLQSSPPLQMTVYGFTLSYATITTAAFGILLAFASKVLIQEVGG